MGIVLDRPFPTFPHGFPADADRRVRAADRPRHARQRRRLRHGDHRPARRRARRDRQADRLHVGRQRVPDRRARRRHPDRRAVPDLRDRVRAGRPGAGRRPRHRPAVRRRPGAFTRTANRHDYALEPFGETLLDRLTRARVPVVSGRQGERSVRRPRHPAERADEQRRATAWTRFFRRWRTRQRAGLRQPRRLRHAVRPPQRRRGYAANLERFDAAAWAVLIGRLRETTCSSSPPTTATIRRRRAPIIRASTCRFC